MITNFIVILSILFAGVFSLFYFLRKDLRDQIEKPKYHFQAQLSRYDSQDNSIDKEGPTSTNVDKNVERIGG